MMWTFKHFAARIYQQHCLFRGMLNSRETGLVVVKGKSFEWRAPPPPSPTPSPPPPRLPQHVVKGAITTLTPH